MTYSEVSPKLFEWEKIFTETLIQFNSSFFIKSSEISKKIDYYSSNFPTSMDDIQEWVHILLINFSDIFVGKLEKFPKNYPKLKKKGELQSPPIKALEFYTHTYRVH